MPWKIIITASAKADIKEIKKWYKKRSFQAVENFTKELVSSIEYLQRDEIEHRIFHPPYRKFLLKSFPYAIYFQRKENNMTVEINAILHNQRDPEFIVNRLYE